jgi:hypothetical protein
MANSPSSNEDGTAPGVEDLFNLIIDAMFIS